MLSTNSIAKTGRQDNALGSYFQTLHGTMCEDTVFWDLNYAIKYKTLGTEEIRSKVLKVINFGAKFLTQILSHPISN